MNLKIEREEARDNNIKMPGIISSLYNNKGKILKSTVSFVLVLLAALYGYLWRKRNEFLNRIIYYAKSERE